MIIKKCFSVDVIKDLDSRPDVVIGENQHGQIAIRIGRVEITEDDIIKSIISSTNYELLENKPQINGVELVGNLTSEDLGINSGAIIGTVDENTIATDGFSSPIMQSDKDGSLWTPSGVTNEYYNLTIAPNAQADNEKTLSDILADGTERKIGLYLAQGDDFTDPEELNRNKVAAVKMVIDYYKHLNEGNVPDAETYDISCPLMSNVTWEGNMKDISESISGDVYAEIVRPIAYVWPENDDITIDQVSGFSFRTYIVDEDGVQHDIIVSAPGYKSYKDPNGANINRDSATNIFTVSQDAESEFASFVSTIDGEERSVLELLSDGPESQSGIAMGGQSAEYLESIEDEDYLEHGYFGYQPGVYDEIVKYQRLAHLGEGGKCECKIEESEINGNFRANDKEIEVYRLPAEYEEYLKKVTYKTPTIDTFMMLQGSGAAIPTVTESGVTFSVASIRHKESNLENINGGLTINSFLPIDPSANVTTVPMMYPASISEDTDFTLSGTDTNGKSFSKTYSIRFNTYVYYDLVPIGETPSETPRNTWISDKMFAEEGYEFTYSVGETLCILAPKSGLKVQTKILGTWADVDYTEDDTVYDITQSNGAASFRYCYRVNFEVGSGSAIYRLVQGD